MIFLDLIVHGQTNLNSTVRLCYGKFFHYFFVRWQFEIKIEKATFFTNGV